VRGLMNQLLRRLERLEGDVLAERRASTTSGCSSTSSSGWKGVDEQLARLEQHLQTNAGTVVYRIRRAPPASGE
jgi:hypothetical protein